ncbi:MAG: iron chaperone [Rhizobiaceae bacterium]
MEKILTIEDYVATLPHDLRDIAQTVRKTVLAAAPGAIEAVKYGMPVFQIDGVSLIYFAVWKKHVGFYPIYKGEAAFEAVIAPYRVKKDTVQFLLNTPIPYELIPLMVDSQLAQTVKK